MACNYPSGFGSEFPVLSRESVTAQFLPENICGEGAECTVYRVRLDGLLVAAKRLSERQRLNAGFVAAYRKEFEIGRRLRHDALPVYREIRADAVEVYIVMDYIDGDNLDDFAETAEGRDYFRDEENMRKFLTELLNVVGYLHRSGVVHCDLKPANIMLRHSDRAAMLIDLDKAYCDTHDLTHGGTPGISDAVNRPEKPTADKDFAAIGRVVDIITGGDKNGIPRAFRRFRSLCDAPGVSADKLRRSLQRPDLPISTVINAIAALSIVVVIGVVLFADRRGHDADIRPSLVEDTITQSAREVERGMRATREADNKTVELSAAHRKAPEKGQMTDFDSGMKKFTEAALSATATLRSGKLTDSELQSLAAQVSDLYLTTCDELREEYKRKHPDASDSDAHTALANALGNSRTIQIMQSFNKELLDTVNARTEKIRNSRE